LTQKTKIKGSSATNIYHDHGGNVHKQSPESLCYYNMNSVSTSNLKPDPLGVGAAYMNNGELAIVPKKFSTFGPESRAKTNGCAHSLYVFDATLLSNWKYFDLHYIPFAYANDVCFGAWVAASSFVGTYNQFACASHIHTYKVSSSLHSTKGKKKVD
jgi:hypothetical protein